MALLFIRSPHQLLSDALTVLPRGIRGQRSQVGAFKASVADLAAAMPALMKRDQQRLDFHVSWWADSHFDYFGVCIARMKMIRVRAVM